MKTKPKYILHKLVLFSFIQALAYIYHIIIFAFHKSKLHPKMYPVIWESYDMIIHNGHKT